MSAKQILSVFYILAYCTVTIIGEKKRLLENIPNNVDSRLHDIEVKLQQLTSQTTDKDMYITQLQSTVLKLQSTVNQLEHDRNNQSAQIQAMQKIGQSGNHHLVDAKGHAQSASTVIHFNEPFAEIPTVVWGTTALDIDHNHNTRFASSVQSITKAGFTMQASTWSDTGIYSVQIQWMACPAHI
ncbi:unnamed protein product [Mytilus edulis]|uniref:H-type lectin domain-containing protein n=1 Tax=Mytilus edulis TaxID=6550 RepID=A0A8S3SIN3_MYTED|nr:unnamed protein product [Mytilus edulis]